MKKLIALAASLVIAASVYAAEFPDITISEVKEAMASKQKIVLLDANGTESWQSGHIPGSIDFSAKEEKLAKSCPRIKTCW